MKDKVIRGKTDMDTRYDILKSFEPLIKKCFRLYVKDYGCYQDTLQEGYATILKCIDNYNPDSKGEFPGYVKTALIRNIRNFSRKISRDISLDEETGEDGFTLLDFLQSDTNIEAEGIQREDITELHRAMEVLTEKQKNIIYEVYFNNTSMVDLCKARRCHYMTIVRLKDRALESLRKELAPLRENI